MIFLFVKIIQKLCSGQNTEVRAYVKNILKFWKTLWFLYSWWRIRLRILVFSSSVHLILQLLLLNLWNRLDQGKGPLTVGALWRWWFQNNFYWYSLSYVHAGLGHRQNCTWSKRIPAVDIMRVCQISFFRLVLHFSWILLASHGDSVLHHCLDFMFCWHHKMQVFACYG